MLQTNFFQPEATRTHQTPRPCQDLTPCAGHHQAAGPTLAVRCGRGRTPRSYYLPIFIRPRGDRLSWNSFIIPVPEVTPDGRSVLRPEAKLLGSGGPRSPTNPRFSMAGMCRHANVLRESAFEGPTPEAMCIALNHAN